MTRKQNNPPRLADSLLKLALTKELYEEKSGDLEEVYRSLRNQKNRTKAAFWYWIQVFRAVPPGLLQSVYWSTNMFRNYGKIAFRQLKKHKVYSFINLAGLTIGMACFVFILLWVQNELSFDRFHEKKDRIYRILNEIPNGNYGRSITYALPPHLKDNYPEVEETARVWPWHRSLVKYNDISFEESQIYLTDPGFFIIFSFEFIYGRPESALPDKNSIVLTEETAKKYFGNDNPLGKVLHLAAHDEDFKVTGVIADIPANSHLQFDMISRVEWLGEDRLARWSEWVAPAYLLLRPEVTSESFDQKISSIYKDRDGDYGEIKPVLQPLAKVHLYESGQSGRITKVYIFSLIAVFVLIMACINFMNLSTARSSHRAKEVGMRKVIGAARSQIIKQFLGEAMMLAFLAMGSALFCVWILLPAFNRFAGQTLTLFSEASFSIFIFLFLTMVVTGFVAGSYPAFYLSSFQPVQTLRKRISSKPGGSGLRKLLIIIQFSISVGLILCTLIVSQQLRFIRNKDLGINHDHVVTMMNNPDLEKQFYTFKQELAGKPGIINITSSAQRPLQVGQSIPVNWEGNPAEGQVIWDYTMADYDFFETFDMEIVMGRSFSREFPTDFESGCIINETAVKQMGLENPIGAGLFFGHMALDQSLRDVTVIGVVKDFHSRSLHSRISPFVFRIYRPFHQYVFIKIDAQRIPDALKNIGAVFKKYSPDYPFQYEFVDDAFNRQYLSEKELQRLFNGFSLLAMVVACLGLFGLASFLVEQKTKEIGIRKVLGASVGGLVVLTTKEFFKWIAAANLIAWPMGYYLMSRWLQNFVYKISIGPMVFLLSAGLVLLIAFFTVSFQIFKAALANPVNSLRYE